MPLTPARSVLAALMSVSVCSAAAQQLVLPSAPPVFAKHAMVVSIHHDASEAGLAILKQGGNAVDAAVAVGFALAVTFPEAGNIGGGGFMLVRMHTGDAHFLDYREAAPAAATAGMYLDAQGNVVAGESISGYKAIGIPGTVAGLAHAQKKYGKLTLAQDMAPAIALATNGYRLSAEEASIVAASAPRIGKFPETRHLFLNDGKLFAAGDIFRQPELAATLKRIAADPREFYTGAMAKTIADSVQKGGGILTAADLAGYTVQDRTPLLGHYRGYDILTSPPPSSGGIVLLEVLNMLSGYDLQYLNGKNAAVTPDRSPEQVQLLIEAFRRAYMDRSEYLGDPAFTRLPIQQMADPGYAAAWAKTIVAGKATASKDLVRPAGFLPPPPAMPAVKESTQTTHFSVVDAEGNAVSSTYTLNAYFGSGVSVGELGFVLNDEMDDFASKPGSPNLFGLIQGPANAIAPGKRPLSSMTPTIVLKPSRTKGKPAELVLITGSPGGATIPTTVINDVVSILDNHLNVQQAADAPRFHHQYLPDRVDVEKKFPTDVVTALRAMGYTVSRLNEADEKRPGVWGDSETIYIDPTTHELLGADDQRHTFGKASGY